MTNPQKEDILKFQRCLLQWYAKHKRDLPWRPPSLKLRKDGTRDPYKILVSEMMLQQTQVDRVIPKYKEFLKLFPTVHTLAQATSTAVIHAWSGLGYNRRALFLKRAAELVVRQYRGRFPRTIGELERLPGVGKYTARAVCCFAYKENIGFVDTNVARVLHRAFYGSDVPKRKVSMQALWAFVEQVVPKGKADTWHYALMDFGALVCIARRPTCEQSSMKDFFSVCKKIAKIDWKTHVSQSKKEPFQSSDRYVRGRIVECLRHAPQHTLPHEKIMKLFFGNIYSRVRLQSIIRGLIRDRLIVRKGKFIAFPR